jgi:hypothetical protein
MLPDKPKSTSYRDYEAKDAFQGQNLKGVDRAAAEARNPRFANHNPTVPYAANPNWDAEYKAECAVRRRMQRGGAQTNKGDILA